MTQSQNAAITTSVEIYNGVCNLLFITNTGSVTVTVSGATPAVANVGLPIAAGSTVTIDVRAADLSKLVLNAVANSGTGALSILAI